MRKTALKAALVAFISLVAVFFLAIGVVSLAFPRTMASVCDSTGLKSAAVYYYRADYERDPDFHKLTDLIDAADYADDDKTLAIYGEKFVLSSEFENFCKAKDEEYSSSISAEYYYAYIVVRALYFKGELNKSASLAGKLTENYEKNCPLYIAVRTALSAEDIEYAKAVRIELVNGSFSDIEGLLQQDREKLNELINGEEQ